MTDEADLAYLRNINTRPGMHAGQSIDPTKPGPTADRIAKLEAKIADYGAMISKAENADTALTPLGLNVLEGRRAQVSQWRAELSRLRNEQPKGGDADWLCLPWRAVPAYLTEDQAEIRTRDGWLLCCLPGDGYADYIVRKCNAPSPAPSPDPDGIAMVPGPNGSWKMPGAPDPVCDCPRSDTFISESDDGWINSTCIHCGRWRRVIKGSLAMTGELLGLNNRDAPSPATSPGPQDVREALIDARNNGLIYWEPNTERGHTQKALMLARIDAALAQSDAPVGCELSELAIAQAIEGPRNPVPDDCKWSLQELRTQKWGMLSHQEQKERLWQARSVIGLLSTTAPGKTLTNRDKLREEIKDLRDALDRLERAL